MGQQQLLLLVLGVVLVGLAVVAGLAVVGEQTRKAEVDRMTVEAHRVAAAAFAWKQTPAAMAGGRDAPFYSTLTLGALGFDDYANDEGGELQVAVRGELEYKLVRRTLPRTHVHVYNTAQRIGAAVFLLGPGPDCFAFRHDVVRNGSVVYVPALTPPRPAGCPGW